MRLRSACSGLAEERDGLVAIGCAELLDERRDVCADAARLDL
jgi:hypothetical protein